jgi:hypothetical protein
MPVAAALCSLDNCKTDLSRFSSQMPKPGEWTPGRCSAQPIACDGPQAALNAVAASWTTRSEEDDCLQRVGMT